MLKKSCRRWDLNPWPFRLIYLFNHVKPLTTPGWKSEVLNLTEPTCILFKGKQANCHHNHNHHNHHYDLTTIITVITQKLVLSSLVKPNCQNSNWITSQVLWVFHLHRRQTERLNAERHLDGQAPKERLRNEKETYVCCKNAKVCISSLRLHY